VCVCVCVCVCAKLRRMCTPDDLAMPAGGMLCVIMLVFYAGTVDNVRRAHFNLFHYTHHLYPLFYLLLFLHGQ